MNAMLWVRTFLSEWHAWQRLGILIARLTVGLLFLFSGRGKLFVPERREQMRETLLAADILFPNFKAIFVWTVEFVGGLLLVVGALTPLACVMLGCVMIVAIGTTAVRNIKASGPTGWLSEFLYSARGALSRDPVLAFFSGPGWFSIDHLIMSITPS